MLLSKNGEETNATVAPYGMSSRRTPSDASISKLKPVFNCKQSSGRRVSFHHVFIMSVCN